MLSSGSCSGLGGSLCRCSLMSMFRMDWIWFVGSGILCLLFRVVKISLLLLSLVRVLGVNSLGCVVIRFVSIGSRLMCCLFIMMLRLRVN